MLYLKRLELMAIIACVSIISGTAHAQQYVPGEIIVKLKGKGKTLQSQAFIGKAVSEKGMSLKGTWNGLNMHHFALKPGQSVESMIAQLKADPDVQYAEPNYIFKLQSTGRQGQPVSLASVRETARGNPSAYASADNLPIQAEDGWSQMSGSADAVVVAVIDTGVDYTHSVFTDSGAIWTNDAEVNGQPGVDDDHNGYVDDKRGWNFVSNNNNPMDDEGHGTHVAGIVLGTSQDITAWTLQPSAIKIMPLKFLDSEGSGTTSDAVKAIYYAANNGARVLNNSWGGGGFSNSLLDAIAYSYTKRAIFLAAAGNAANNNDSSPTYPANYPVPNIVSIAATSTLDGFAGFSNYGKSTVHMGAPGVSIWSTFPDETFASMSGTSMATPFAAGLAALIIREAPTMSGYEAKQILFQGAEGINSLKNRTITGDRLNINGSIVAAKAASIDGSQPSYNASADREPSSMGAEEAAPACGLVGKAIFDSSGGGPSGPQKNLMFFAVLALLVSPIVVSVLLRERDGKSRRRHTRYMIDSAVTLKLGERELVGHVSTISMGGVQLNTDAWLENGGIVKMSIASPDGKEQIDVEGRIVWSEEKKRYGVAFENTAENVRSAIADWTQSLLKAN